MTNCHACYSFSNRHRKESQIVVITLQESSFQNCDRKNDATCSRENHMEPSDLHLQSYRRKKSGIMVFCAHSGDNSSLSFSGKIEVRVQRVLVT